MYPVGLGPWKFRGIGNYLYLWNYIEDVIVYHEVADAFFGFYDLSSDIVEEDVAIQYINGYYCLQV